MSGFRSRINLGLPRSIELTQSRSCSTTWSAWKAEYDLETGVGMVPIKAPFGLVDGEGVVSGTDVEPIASEWAYRRVTFASTTVEVDDAF